MNRAAAAIWPHLYVRIPWWRGTSMAICLGHCTRSGKFHPWLPSAYRWPPPGPCPPPADEDAPNHG